MTDRLKLDALARAIADTDNPYLGIQVSYQQVEWVLTEAFARMEDAAVQGGLMIEPMSVVSLVETYVLGELANCAKYENRVPLDESGIYSLHCLASDIYAIGVRDGEDSAGARNRESRHRLRAVSDEQ